MVDIRGVTTLCCSRRHYLTALESTGFKLFDNLVGFKNPEILFNGTLPDTVEKNSNKLTVIELSCCYETNFVKTRNSKVERYSKLQDLCVDKNFRVTELYVKVSSLEFLPKNIQKFRNFCKQYDCINVMKMMEKLSEVDVSMMF